MKSLFKDFFFTKPLLFGVLMALIGNAVLYFFISSRVVVSENPIPLHYNIYFNIDFQHYWYYIYVIPALGSVIFLINTVMALLFFRKNMLLTYFFVFASMICQIILIIAGIFSLLLNV